MRQVLKTVDSFLAVLYSLGKAGRLEGNTFVLADVSSYNCVRR